MKLLFVVLAGLLLAPLAPAQTAESRRPNVVVILADDVGFADLGCQGSAELKSPRIDSVAAAGVRFNAGYVSAPQCGPSRAGLLSGRSQNRFPVTSLDILPTALAAAGVESRPAWKLDGKNLLPFLTGARSDASHEALCWRFHFPSSQPARHHWAIRRGDWKLVRNDREPLALYNLAEDVGEAKNLAAEQPVRVRAMEAAWKAWDAGNREPFWGEPLSVVAETSQARAETHATEIWEECTGNDPQLVFAERSLDAW